MLRIRIAGNWLYRMRSILATLLLIVLAAGICYKIVFGANGMKIYDAKRAEHERLRRELMQYESENQQLQKQVRSLTSDPKTIEKEAREQLGYVKRGETVLVQPQANIDVKAVDVAQGESR